MRIGIDVKTIALHSGGITAMLQAVLPLLVDRFPTVDWCAFGPPDGCRQLPVNVRTVPIPMFPRLGGARQPIYDQWQLRRAAVRERIDLFYSPYFDLPVRWSIPVVLTMHDAVYFRFPQLYSRAIRTYYQAVMRAHGRSARAIVTDSEFSRRELVATAGVDDARLHVVPIGLRPDFRRPSRDAEAAVAVRLGLPTDYVLYSGGVEERKNLSRLLVAYARWRTRHPAAPALVLTGRRERWAAFDSEIRTLGLAGAICFAGRVDDAEMPAVYGNARMVIYPSLYEGFGLPLVEAMRCGVPAAASNCASLPEIGGDAVHYFEPTSIDAIVEALDVVCRDEGLRQRLVEAGRARAECYTVERTAAGVAAAIERAAEGL